MYIFNQKTMVKKSNSRFRFRMKRNRMISQLNLTLDEHIRNTIISAGPKSASEADSSVWNRKEKWVKVAGEIRKKADFGN